MAWTVARNGSTYTIIPLRGSDNRSPSWKRTPRETILPRLGTDYSTYHQFGFNPWIWDGAVRIESESDYNGVGGFLGYEVTFSDGTDSWTTVLQEFDVDPISAGLAGYEGRMRFVGRS